MTYQATQCRTREYEDMYSILGRLDGLYKKLKGILIDAAQAQGIAKGRTNEPKTLSQAGFNEAVIEYVQTKAGIERAVVDVLRKLGFLEGAPKGGPTTDCRKGKPRIEGLLGY